MAANIQCNNPISGLLSHKAAGHFTQKSVCFSLMHLYLFVYLFILSTFFVSIMVTMITSHPEKQNDVCAPIIVVNCERSEQSISLPQLSLTEGQMSQHTVLQYNIHNR